jgi:hypothetical protein
MKEGSGETTSAVHRAASGLDALLVLMLFENPEYIMSLQENEI